MIKKITILLLLIIISIVFYFNNREDNSRKYSFSTKRVFNKISLKEKKVIKHNFNSTDYIVKSDFIYYKDFPKQQIVKINYNGEIINKYGKKGEGPKETLMIRAYDIDSISYKVIDANKNSFARISFNNELLKYFKSKNNINTGCFINDNKILIKGSEGAFGKRKISFSIIDLTHDAENTINTFDIFKNKDNSDWIYDGFFNKTIDNGAIYATHYSNIFLKFDNKGTLVYNKKFIYTVPEIKLSMVGTTLFPIENDNPNFYSFTSNKKYIFFLTSIGSKEYKNNIIIDVYNIEKGSYYSSVALNIDKEDGFPSIIRVYENNFFAFYDNKYKIYEIIEK